MGVFAKLLEDGIFGNEPDPGGLNFSFAPFTALGVAISLFLGFHNNASYGRWWEARILWGTQIIAMRNLIRFLISSLVQVFDEEQPNEEKEGWRQVIIRLGCAQTHALRAQLRPKCSQDEPGSALEDRDKFLTDSEHLLVTKSVNPANAILTQAAKLGGEAHRRGEIDSYQMIQLSKLIDHLCHIQTACERIQNTALPLAYSLLVHRTASLYVLLAPFAIVESMGWWTPVFAAILAYTFFGLDELARQIQDPFADEPSCLALSAMSRTVEIDTCEALEREVPPFLKPVRSILM